LVRQLANNGFVDPGEESLELVRIPELRSRWSAFPARSRSQRPYAPMVFMPSGKDAREGAVPHQRVGAAAGLPPVFGATQP
jgi:hypothetical protein